MSDFVSKSLWYVDDGTGKIVPYAPSGNSVDDDNLPDSVDSTYLRREALYVVGDDGKLRVAKKDDFGSSILRESEQSTTAGLWWSETKEKLTLNINGKEESPLLKPMYQRKKIVFFGSSTTDGRGTTTKSNAYMSLLASALSAKGYECYIRGVGGDNTTKAIERFYKDIAPLNADYCFIAFTIGNEGIYNASDKDIVYQQFKAGLFNIIRLVKQHGMVPIVANQMPTQNYTAEIYRYARNLNAELDAMDVHVVDWMGAVVDETTYMPIPAASFDHLHLNDTGHSALYQSIPPSLFEKVGFQSGKMINTPEKGSIHIESNTNADYVFRYSPEYPLASFSAFVRFKAPSVIDIPITLIGAYGDGGYIRIQLTNTGVVAINPGTEVKTTAIISDTNWHTLGIRYNVISKKIKLYLDNEVISDETVSASLTSVDNFYLAGRPSSTNLISGYEFKDFAVYRTAQIAENFRLMIDGTFPQTSLELLAPLNDKVLDEGSRLMNLAPTTRNLTVKKSATISLTEGSI
ncbi:SGNH/GDSL hydrolase family protein [Paenibacillus thailandensis]|uniref:SGNH/GDSL hydrolase family protein n=1 Tax=Paenibacillus thailandensis TaxID=393250 RepID=A0ABW5R2K7_9BACL